MKYFVKRQKFIPNIKVMVKKNLAQTKDYLKVLKV